MTSKLTANCNRVLQLLYVHIVAFSRVRVLSYVNLFGGKLCQVRVTGDRPGMVSVLMGVMVLAYALYAIFFYYKSANFSKMHLL